MRHIKIFDNFEAENLILSDLDKSSGGELRNKLRKLILSDTQNLKSLIKKGKIDPNIENCFILRKSIQYSKNDLLELVAPISNLPDSGKFGLIVSCYEYDNMEAIEIIFDNFEITKSDLEKSIRWMKNSIFDSESVYSKDRTKVEQYISDINKRIQSL